MGRKQKARNRSTMDGNIIEFLMLAEESEITASDISVGIGMLRAADVTPRLNALHEKGIVRKNKINKRVYWSVTDDSAATNDVIPDSSNDAFEWPEPPFIEDQESSPTVAPDANELQKHHDSLIDALLTTVEQLKSEVTFLREEVRVRDAQFSSFLETHAPIIPIAPVTPSCANVDTPEFTTPKRTCAPPRSWSPGPVMVSNHFATLEVDEGSDPANERGDERFSFLTPSTTTGPLRRPGVVVNNHPENERFVSKKAPTPISWRRARPGTRSRKKIPRVVLVGDSIIKDVTGYDAEKGLIYHDGTKEGGLVAGGPVRVRPNHGAKIDDMYWHIQPLLNNKPDIIYLHVGTNDLTDYAVNLDWIALQYERLIRYIESQGIIVVVSLITMRNTIRNDRVIDFNKLLVNVCTKLCVNFVFNCNITSEYLNSSGIHLNAKGTNLFIENFSDFMNYLVPIIYRY